MGEWTQAKKFKKTPVEQHGWIYMYLEDTSEWTQTKFVYHCHATRINVQENLADWTQTNEQQWYLI